MAALTFQSALILIVSVIVYGETDLLERSGAAPPSVECVDNAPSCIELTTECNKPSEIDWMYQFCRLACGFCDGKPSVYTTTTVKPTTTTTQIVEVTSATVNVDPTCLDKIDNCNEYQLDTCTNPEFVDWAHNHCPHYCNLCQGPTTTPTPTTSETPHPDGLVCFDRIDCEAYDKKTTCCGTYEPWARHNCARYCKFCEPAVTIPPLCTDIDDKCDQYGEDLCTNPDYERFVKENCAGHCKLCDQPEYIPPCALPNGGVSTTSGTAAVTTEKHLTTSSPGACEDLIDCSNYNITTSCCGVYETWARLRCRKSCKFCVPDVVETPLCTDVEDNCNEYGDDLCTNPAYDKWVKEHCAGFCKVCERPEIIPSCANITTTTAPIQTIDCISEGKLHPVGSSWQTKNCAQTCTCISGPDNNIQCDRLRCPVPPPNCDTVTISGQCCPFVHNCRN